MPCDDCPRWVPIDEAEPGWCAFHGKQTGPDDHCPACPESEPINQPYFLEIPHES